MPVVAAAVVVSGIMQYYNSEKARGATNDRLNQIKALFDGIVPPSLNIKVWDDPKLAQSLPTPALNLEKITPEQFKSVGQFVPEVAHYVQEANPTLVKATATGEAGRQAQMDALSRYKEIAGGGVDPQFAQAQQDAATRAQQEAQSRSASILQDANRRGQLGSGVAMAAQLQGSSDAMTNAALTSQRAATDAYRNRLQALGQSAQLGGDIRSSDTQEQARNAGIINDFNQRTSRAQQDWQNQRAATLNHANQFNLQNSQDIDNRNTSQNNQFSQYNQQYGNSMAQQAWQNQRQTQQDQQALQRYRDSLQQQQFNDQLGLASAKAGTGYQGINFLQQGTRDQNNAIQGIGNGVTAGAMYYGQQNAADQAQDNWEKDYELRKQRLSASQDPYGSGGGTNPYGYGVVS